MLPVRDSDFLSKVSCVFSKVTDPETVPETLPIGESDSMPDSDEETEEIEDTSTPDQPEEHSGECFGDAGLGKEEHFCCIPAVLSMDDLQVPGTQPWPAARSSRWDQCWCNCSLTHTGLFSMRTLWDPSCSLVLRHQSQRN